MSLDYSRDCVLASGRVSATINSGGLEVGNAVWSKNYKWIIKSIEIRIVTAATQASQTVKLQSSSTAGSFSSPTDLLSSAVTIASGDAANTLFTARVPDASAQLDAGQIVRIFHTVGSNEASLVYDYKVIGTVIHE